MSDIVEEMGGYMGDGSEFTQPTQDPKTTHAIDYAYPTPQASQVWDGDNPPGVTTAVSLANAPQATDPNSHKDCEQCRSEEKMQQALAKATKPELVSVSPKEFGEAFFKRHDEATKPVDELMRITKGAAGDIADGHLEHCYVFNINDLNALISNQVASAVKEARIDEAHKAWVLIGNSPKSQAGKELLRLQHERIATLNGVTK